MGLRLKFNIVMLTVFAIGLALCSFFIDRLTQQAAQRSVLGQAKLMMGAANAVLHYSDEQVMPLLLRASRVQFLPQAIPFFAANRVFDRLAADFPQYSFHQPTPNPTNPSDKPAPWESPIVEAFKTHPNLDSLVQQRTTAAGAVLSYAEPTRLTEQGCLSCHSTPAAAPPTLLDIYGRENGFGWQLGSVVGAKVVSVPVHVVEQQARHDFRIVMAILGAIFGVMLLLLNALLEVFIIRPVRRIARAADAISLGDTELPEFNETSRDEIGALAQAFNRMRRSLVTAMSLLET
ncbi:MAG: DUF3365 domain-containing protein [Rhodopila sp.]